MAKKKKKSPSGRKEVKDNLIEAEQSQETPIRSVQSSPIEDAEDIKSIEDSEGIKDIEDVENIGDIEDMKDIENIKDVADIEDVEDIENIEDIDTLENSEGIDDIEVEEADDIKKMEGSETIGCTKKWYPNWRTRNRVSKAKKWQNTKLQCHYLTQGIHGNNLGTKGRRCSRGSAYLISRR